MINLQAFLTAYDPSDLPGGSVDPLGFDRGYTLLAEKFLPGLTNVASRPRYLSVLCAAIALSDERAKARVAESPRARLERRSEAVQRLERFWALACVMASEKDEAFDPGGVRGVSYASAALRRLREQGATSTDAKYRLLSRQLTYGLLGIYGTVADNLLLVDRQELRLTSDLGARLGEAFLDETDLPSQLRVAVAEGGTVKLSALEAWGQRAHVNGSIAAREGKALSAALCADDTRRRSAALLERVAIKDDETELQRLQRVAERVSSSHEDADIRETLRAILGYEQCYGWLLLVFQRVLWFLESEEPYAYDLDRAESDPVFPKAVAKISTAWRTFDAAIAEGKTPAFVAGLDRIADVRAFVGRAAAAKTPAALLEQVLARHREVQRAKLDGGRPKMPWAEIVGASARPTLTAAQRAGREPRAVMQMLPHPYRTEAADRLRQAGVAL